MAVDTDHEDKQGDIEMASSTAYRSLKGSKHPHPSEHKKLHSTDGAELLTVTLMLRRKAGHDKPRPEAMTANRRSRPSRDVFASAHGAEPGELDAVTAFAKAAGLNVLDVDAARRSVIDLLELL